MSAASGNGARSKRAAEHHTADHLATCANCHDLHSPGVDRCGCGGRLYMRGMAPPAPLAIEDSYRLCPGCRHETLHRAGQCLFCQPRGLASVIDHCRFCDGPFDRAHGAEFCSTACRKKHWLYRTDAGNVWRAEQNRRRRETARARTAELDAQGLSSRGKRKAA